MSDVGGLTVTIDPPGDEPPATRRSRPRWRRPHTIALVAVATVLAVAAGGAATVWSSVPLPVLPPLPEPTTLYYADGENVLARIGDVNRTVLPSAEILPTIIDVAVAAEDPAFWTSSAGPITRAVVRQSFDIVETGNTNARIRVWIMARKLEATHSKQEILARYLNGLPFGRQAYGIEAAARAYFGKSASIAAPPAGRLTLAEAMALLALPEAAEDSRQRWTEIREALVEQTRAGRAQAVTEGELSGLTYPEPVPPVAGPSDLSEPVGLALGHILAELTTTAGSPFQGWTWDEVRNGGFKITTTIDIRAQKIVTVGAEAGEIMAGQPPNLQAAAVVVEAATGRVLAYYGGPDGTGLDYAGLHHPPAGSFMVYTLAAALTAGHPLDSQWQWTPHEQVGRPPDQPIRNFAQCPGNPRGDMCSLLDSVVASLNVPLYDVTANIGVPAVLAMARDAGIRTLRADDGTSVDLTSADLSSLTMFSLEAGIGQYPVTVLDQAAAMATFAGGGVPAPAHFVRSVTEGDEVRYTEPAAGNEPVLTAAALADLREALTRAPGDPDLAIKTGSWPLPVSQFAGANSDVWSIGFTDALGVAVWVGNRADVQGLYDKDGNVVYGSGLPTRILREVVTGIQGLG